MKTNSEHVIQDRIRDLRENTDFVSTLFESLVGYAIVAADFDGNIIAYNEGARQIYGYAPEEIIGKENIEIFFPNEFIEAGELQRIIDDLIGKGRYSYEGEKVRKSVEIFPAQVLFTLTRDRNGKVVGFIEIVEDLTERKRAEEALASSKAYAESIIQNFLDTLIVVDAEAKIQTVNPATRHLLGYAEEELIGKPVSIFFAEEEEEEEEVHRLFQFFRESEKAEPLRPQDTIRNRELTYKTKDARLIPMSFNASVLTDEAGNVTGVVAGAKDITEPKLAEAKLRKEKNFSENIIATVPDSLLVLDSNLRIKSANRTFYETFRTEPETVIGTRITKILDDKDGKLGTELTRLFGTKNMLENFEFHYQSQKLSERIFNITARGILVEEEELLVIEDITERKQAEKKLRESQAQLIQAEKMTAMGTMTAGVAHELNNPMMGLLNFIQYCLKHTSEDDRRYTVLQDAVREANRCITIVQNLLVFSRTGTYVAEEEEEEEEEGDEILDTVFGLLSYRIEKENVSVTRHAAEGTPEFWMNVNNIQQVFLNLINNALDALKESKKKEIYVDIHREGDFIQVTIADSGCGIAPENLQRIFDPFFTTKPVGQGTGLGLSICFGIIEEHGGEITCESNLGAGTKFNILLPINKKKKRKEEETK